MFKNFILTAIRNLKRNKIYASLNVLGLALGIGCAMVIYKVITHELSYDKFQSNYSNVYRVVKEDIYPDRVDYNQGLPHPFMVAVRDEFTQFEVATRIHYAWGDQINAELEDGSVQRIRLEEGLAFAEPQLFDVFDFEVVAGDAKRALESPGQAVVSFSFLEKVYGIQSNYEQAIGKTFNLANAKEIVIQAVIKNPPKNTDFPFTVIASYDSQKGYNDYYFGGKEWNSSSGSTQGYVLLKQGLTPESLKDPFNEFVKKHYNEKAASEVRYYLQPLSDLHYDSHFMNYSGRTISKKLLMALSVIGLFLVVTACINFINLATAQAVKRAKEIGIRKSIGVSRFQLVIQFLSETMIITIIAVGIALGLSELLLQNLQEILGYQLSLNIMVQPLIIPFLVLLVIFVTLLSGFYPAILLSRMDPVDALKNKVTSQSSGSGLTLRRALVIIQFTISQALIIGTLVVGAQMNYFLSKDLGFESEAMLTAYLPDNRSENVNELRYKLTKSPAIKDVTFSLAPPTGNSNSHSNFNHPNTKSENDYHGNFKAVDHRYVEFFDLELLAGRNFRETDSMQLAIINKKTFELLNLESYDEALGMTMETGFRTNKKIIGVVDDFHSKSLKEDMDYVFLVYDPDIYYEVTVKIASNGNNLVSAERAIKDFKEAWSTTYPDYIFDYTFLDEELAERYEAEQRLSSLFRMFALIAIFIGCLGLYGLISFLATQKVKEIGVRKVLGASVWSIVHLFSKEMMILLVIAFVIAAPVSYYFLMQWLSDFKYRIDFNWIYFLVSIATSFIIAMVTIGYKTYFAATVNPALSLKDE